MAVRVSARDDRIEEARATAAAIGLRHVLPYQSPGFTRRRSGGGFTYVDDRGRRIGDRAAVERARHLAIPPAWVEVWICRDARGHIQAAGRDARRRLQYIYHPRWREVRSAQKYGRLASFTRALPGLRRRVARDLRCPCLCRETVAASVVALIESGHLRVGNDVYARENGSYGATTLECRHLRLHGAHIELKYRGKSGIPRHIEIEHPSLAAVVRRLRALPGRRLFQYRDDGGLHPVSANDVNAYLHETIGAAYSAKDFRTWAASLWCALVLGREAPPDGVTARKKAVRAAICEVADRLGHTPTICRTSYIHPGVLAAYDDGRLHRRLPQRLCRTTRGIATLRAAERHVLALLASDGRAGARTGG